MRITFLKAGGWGNAGGDRVIAIHAENLQRRGHHVTVVAVPPPPISLKHRIRDILLGRKRTSTPTSVLFDGKTFDRILLDKFRVPQDKDLPDADILITTWYETAEWAQHLHSSKGRRVSFIQGYEAFDFTPIDRLDATWRLPQPKITISKWLFDLAREKFDQDDVFLVPNSVDRTQFSVSERVRTPIPTIGFLYHTLYSKGVGTCLDVIERIARNGKPIKIVTFGHGAFSPTLPPHVEHQHYDNPAQSFIKDIYAQCDLWLCGSSSEGFHLPPLEAMACGCPVVSTMVGGPLDTIIDGYNGYLVPIGDVDALTASAETVLQLADDDWARLSRQAASTGIDYSWENASEMFERCLEEVAGRST